MLRTLFYKIPMSPDRDQDLNLGRRAPAPHLLQGANPEWEEMYETEMYESVYGSWFQPAATSGELEV
jgi:hypothetical protein